MEKKLKTVQ